MPLSPIHPLREEMYSAFNSAIGTPAGGIRTQLVVPWRGYITEVGFVPQSTVTSATTMAAAISDNTPSSAASAFVQFVTSTLGTFSSVNLQEGRVASVAGLNQYANEGDMVQITTSGGNSSTIGGICYFKIRRG